MDDTALTGYFGIVEVMKRLLKAKDELFQRVLDELCAQTSALERERNKNHELERRVLELEERLEGYR